MLLIFDFYKTSAKVLLRMPFILPTKLIVLDYGNKRK